MRLDTFDNQGFDRGRSRLVEAAWLLLQALLVAGPVPGSRWRVGLLRLFGARIGKGVVIHPRVRVKFPWRLVIGDHSWIGEGVWIDNLVDVRIGDSCCLSQGAYLCTGNHRWNRPAFDLAPAPIVLGSRVWIGAMARVAPGVKVGEGAVLTLGGVAHSDLEAWQVYGGVPARRLGSREASARPRP